MNIGALNTTALRNTTQVSPTSSPGGAATPAQGDSAIKGSHHHGHGGGMMQDLLQALSDAGVTTDAAQSVASSATAAAGSSTANATTAPSSSGSTSVDASGVDATTSANQVAPAVQQFIHDLLQSIQSAQALSGGSGDTSSSLSALAAGSTSGTSATPSDNLGSGLQGLIAQMGSGFAANSPAPANLQGDFQKLVAALGAGKSAANAIAAGAAGSSDDTSTGASTPRLQAFLTTLLGVAGANHASSSSIGNNVSTLA